MSIFDKPGQTNHPEEVPSPGTIKTQPQASDPGAGIFDRIGKAEVSRQGVYPLPGVYPVLYVDAVKLIKSRNGEDLFIAEFFILESSTPERPAGSRMTWMTNLRHDAAPGNARAFIAGAMGCAVEEVTSEAASLSCSATNPCHGRLVRLEASLNTKGTFTLCNWISLPEENQAQAEEALKTVFPS